jgi:hypothetical protein
MPSVVVVHKVKARAMSADAPHSVERHTFLLPKPSQGVSPTVIAQQGQVSTPRPCAGGGNDGVAGVAAKALQIIGRMGMRLIEFNQGLAQSNHIQGALNGWQVHEAKDESMDRGILALGPGIKGPRPA